MGFEEPAQSEVGDLQAALACYEEVGCLEIPVNYIVLMEEPNPLEHLVEEALYLGDAQGVVPPNLPKIEVDIFHDYEGRRDSLLPLSSP